MTRSSSPPFLIRTLLGNRLTDFQETSGKCRRQCRQRLLKRARASLRSVSQPAPEITTTTTCWVWTLTALRARIITIARSLRRLRSRPEMEAVPLIIKTMKKNNNPITTAISRPLIKTLIRRWTGCIQGGIKDCPVASKRTSKWAHIKRPAMSTLMEEEGEELPRILWTPTGPSPLSVMGTTIKKAPLIT